MLTVIGDIVVPLLLIVVSLENGDSENVKLNTWLALKFALKVYSMFFLMENKTSMNACWLICETERINVDPMFFQHSKRFMSLK